MRPTGAVAALALLLAGRGASARQERLRLERRPGEVYLAEGGGRLLLLLDGRHVPSYWGHPRVPLGDGGPVLVVRPREGVRVWQGWKERGRISLRETLARWLPKDEIRGNHAQANQVRYTNTKGGIAGWLANVTPVGGSALGLLTWRAHGPSMKPIVAVHLVRIRAAPRPSIELVRRLENTVIRLYRLRQCLLLYRQPGEPWIGLGVPPKPTDTSELVRITPAGEEVSLYASLPPQLAPVGLLGGRWLILGEPRSEAAEPIQVYDLRFGKRLALPGPWARYPNADYIHVPDSGTSILVAVHAPRLEQSRTYVVAVPGGRRVAIANPTGSGIQYLWRGRVVIVGRDGVVAVHNPRTGKPVARLRLRPGELQGSRPPIGALARGRGHILVGHPRRPA